MDLTPDPIAFQLGPLPVYWYGIAYATGLAACYWLLVREARRRGLDANLVGNGIIIVAIAALAGGRLYHVIDQWQLYRDDLAKIVLPPYTGLGVYGGLVTGTAAGVLYARYKGQSVARWADVIAPALFLMQAIGRWGNFFNQELYGPPTTLPWGIPIDCAHRLPEYACPPAGPYIVETLFQPLFLYESLSGFLGAAFLLWLGRRFNDRLRPGDLLLVFFAWYAIVRFALESLRTGNWIVGDIPVAQLFSIGFVAVAVVLFVVRHRRPGPSTAEVERAAASADVERASAPTVEPASG
jgi:phosphatidylglycerol:prolipoprotein diacylglycerol transferase